MIPIDLVLRKINLLILRKVFITYNIDMCLLEILQNSCVTILCYDIQSNFKQTQHYESMCIFQIWRQIVLLG